jgi:hypothetical protein
MRTRGASKFSNRDPQTRLSVVLLTEYSSGLLTYGFAVANQGVISVWSTSLECH